MNYVEIVRGLVRPFIAVSLTIDFCYLSAIGKIPIEAVVAATGLVFGAYFMERALKKKAGEGQ